MFKTDLRSRYKQYTQDHRIKKSEYVLRKELRGGEINVDHG